MANISNSTSNTVINGTIYSDTIDSSYYATYVTINADDGDDWIDSGDNFSINAGAGNDTIIVYYSDYSTINAFEGDDVIKFYIDDHNGNLIQYNLGDGKDTIYGYNSTDTIQISGSSYSTSKSNNDLIIKVGSGSMTLKDSADIKILIQNVNGNLDVLNPNGRTYIFNTESNTTIVGSNYDDTIDNFGDYTSINTGIGNDHIYNNGYYATINAGDGNDRIRNHGTYRNSNKIDYSLINAGAGDDEIWNYYENSTIDAGTGNDDIFYDGDYSSINAGIGNDTIFTLYGSYSTINAAEGDDLIRFSSNSKNNLIQYNSGDGKDTIYDYSSTDTIQISGSTYSTSKSGNDIIIKVGSGSMTIKDIGSETLNIVTIAGGVIDTQSTYETAVTLASTFTGTYESDDEVIKIDASKVKSAIEIYGNDNNNSITGSSKNDTIYGGDGKDLIKGGSGNDFLAGESGNDTLTGGVGADIFYFDSNEGTDTITDYSASQGDKIQLGVSSMTTSKSGNNLILKVGTGKITVKNGNKSAVSVVGANGNTTVVGGSSNPDTLPSGLSYTNNKKTLNVTSFTKTLDLSKYASTVTNVDASTNKKFVTIKGTSRNELIKAGKAGSNLIGGTGNDTLYGGSGADTFTYSTSDGKDLIYNYTSYVDTINIKSGTISKASISGSDVVLTVGSGSITIKNAKSKDINITDSSGETGTYNFTKTVTNPTKNYSERDYWFIEDSTQNDELESIINEKNNLIVDDLNFNDQINSQKKITSLTFNQAKKK